MRKACLALLGCISLALAVPAAAEGHIVLHQRDDKPREDDRHQLTPEQLRMLLWLRAHPHTPLFDTRSLRERCIDDELARLTGEPSYLALRTIRLKCGG
jgi:hypothetical protein